MTFLADYWFVFLAVSTLLLLGAVALQLRNMRLLLRGDDNITQRFVLVAVCALAGSLTFVLFLIGVIAALIRYSGHA